MTVVAVDAAGGDYAPHIPVEGALKAVNENGCSVILVGDQNAIEQELSQHSYPASQVAIHHADDEIDMSDNISQAIRKRGSSMRVAYQLHKEGKAQGVMSAGHSGAMLALGKMILGTMERIDRPCIGALMPKTAGGTLLLSDAGANMDCQPHQLLQFALLSSVYMSEIHRVETPKVALLNVGSEEGKGDELSKAAYELLKRSSLEFIGNVEGKNFFHSAADIIICDGFAGNVMLKGSQGAAMLCKEFIKESITDSIISKVGAFFMQSVFRAVARKSDYARYGGAPLLGLRGVGVVAHGGSSPEAIQTAVSFAAWAAEANVNQKIEDMLLANSDLLSKVSTESKP